MKSRHPAAARCLNNGLFDGLTTFAEIEARISNLPTTKDIGDAFEVFAEAYLATQKIAQSVGWGELANPNMPRITVRHS